MSEELISQLRVFAAAADHAGNAHWAATMRDAVDAIKALSRPAPAPVAVLEGMAAKGESQRPYAWAWECHAWCVTAHGKHRGIRKSMDVCKPPLETQWSDDFIRMFPLYDHPATSAPATPTTSGPLEDVERVAADGLCQEDDGCPTEKAVLQREWRTLRAQLAERERAFNRLEHENLERAEAVIMQAANCRSLADALKALTQAARISGGVAGADSNLMAACEKAENALSFVGVGRAINDVLDVLDERDRLAEKLAASEARVGVLEKSLRHYGAHSDHCEKSRFVNPSVCTCGYEAALSQPKGDSNDQAK